MEIIAELILQLAFQVVGGIIALPFRGFFGAAIHEPLFDAIPLIPTGEESTLTPEKCEHNKRLELYYTRGYW
jgi:hypothetical protein